MKFRGSTRVLVISVAALGFLIEASLSQQWMRLALASSDIYGRRLCDNYLFWTETQRKLCIQYGDLIPHVGHGAMVAYMECRHQFKWRRWNCTAQELSSSWKDDGETTASSLFGNSLVPDSKEAAFVSALFSAGVVYYVTKACSSSHFASCSCEHGSSDEGSRWSHCSDNVSFGVHFSRDFVDSVETNWDLRRMYSGPTRLLMNLHNNEAGRRAVSSNLAQQCSCHGVSGSCVTRVCTRRLPPFRQIGNELKGKFDTAIQVELTFIGGRQALVPLHEHSPPVTTTDLVYLAQSPLYCSEMTGRRCKPKASKVGSCDALCCGRGYRRKEKTDVRNCKCRFLWCCKVECEKCIQRKKFHTCK